MMDKEMIAFCGSYCGVCAWKDKVGCAGCKKCAAKFFGGECDKAKCCIGRGFDHCGECPDMPCEKLKDLFDDPEHGDQGVRMRNLQSWTTGKDTYEKLGNAAQEQVKEL